MEALVAAQESAAATHEAPTDHSEDPDFKAVIERISRLLQSDRE